MLTGRCTWRTAVSASDVLSHAFDDVDVSVCGRVKRLDCRERVKGERRCKACERGIKVAREAEKARQGGLPL